MATTGVCVFCALASVGALFCFTKEMIYEQLYEVHLKNADYPLGVYDRELTKEEWETYLDLIDNLPNKLKEKFLRYNELSNVRHAEETKNAYKYGFKNAVCLLTEALKNE